jgi:hypothetical protein
MDDFRDETGDEHTYYALRSALGDVIPEILPSREDTNGHWGFPANGLQLSLRFRRTEYVRGETIPAIVILRNLASLPRTLLLTNSPALYLTFTVRCGTNAYLPERQELTIKRSDYYTPPLAPPHGVLSWELESKSERVAVLNLNRIFDLSQLGEYSISAHCQVFSSPNNPPTFEVPSGEVSFKIVEKLSISGLKEKNDWEKQRKDCWQRFNKYLQMKKNNN